MANTLVMRLRARLVASTGFTLIELMIVVFILGIVSSIALVSITGALRSANIKACETDYRSVDTAVQSFLSDNPSGWPGSNDLYVVSPATAMATGSLADQGYISKLSSTGKYSIVLGGNSAATYTITVKNGAGTALSGSTIASCSAI